MNNYAPKYRGVWREIIQLHALLTMAGDRDDRSALLHLDLNSLASVTVLWIYV